MKKKSYKITFSLQEGYEPQGKIHSFSFAGHLIQRWLAGRIQQQLPVITGLLQQGTLFFPSKAADGNFVTASPTAIFTGELSSPLDIKRKNKEVMKTLESLAIHLKKELRQESVFIIYRDKNWCV